MYKPNTTAAVALHAANILKLFRSNEWQTQWLTTLAREAHEQEEEQESALSGLAYLNIFAIVQDNGTIVIVKRL